MTRRNLLRSSSSRSSSSRSSTSRSTSSKSSTKTTSRNGGVSKSGRKLSSVKYGGTMTSSKYKYNGHRYNKNPTTTNTALYFMILSSNDNYYNDKNEKDEDLVCSINNELDTKYIIFNTLEILYDMNETVHYAWFDIKHNRTNANLTSWDIVNPIINDEFDMLLMINCDKCIIPNFNNSEYDIYTCDDCLNYRRTTLCTTYYNVNSEECVDNLKLMETCEYNSNSSIIMINIFFVLMLFLIKIHMFF